jgi:NitT/TauT family transport system permease protein
VHWNLLLPNFDRILSLLREHGDYFAAHWWATLSVSLTASALAIAVSLAMGIAATRFRAVEVVLTPAVAISQSFPLQAIAPIIIILMGVGFHTKLSIAFVIAFFPIYGTCLTALKTTPQPILAHLAVCRASFLNGMRHARIPAALPAIISAAKIGFTLAVLGAVVAEFIHPDKGLGHVLLVAQSNYDIDVIYICVALLMVQGLSMYGLLSMMENYIIRRRAG